MNVIMTADVESPFDEETSPLDWQQSILDLLDEEPDNYVIHWYYNSKKYDTGDMADLAKYLAITRDDVLFCSPTADVANRRAISKCIKKMNRHPRVLLFTVYGNTISRRTYGIIQTMKDAIFSLDDRTIAYDIPHVVVLSTVAPNTTMYSKGKLKLHQITDYRY